jgi:hypothetical protein
MEIYPSKRKTAENPLFKTNITMNFSNVSGDELYQIPKNTKDTGLS